MNLWLLKPGHKVRIAGGAEAEVLSETEDGAWVKVRYLRVEDGQSLVGTEDLVGEVEVEALLGVARRAGWDEKVAVVLYHVPESEESEEGYEAVTMKGVPYGVIVTGSATDSAKEALGHLVSGLKAFGFVGHVAVEDATHIGGAQRYEVEVAP